MGQTMRLGRVVITALGGLLLVVGGVVARPDTPSVTLREEARKRREEAATVVVEAERHCRRAPMGGRCIQQAYERQLQLLQEARALEIEARQIEQQRWGRE
ncbi:MAG: hypothetical protein N2557_04985 [Hydrogenophilus sp.]|nr:hypothetical protein [Hydrogenophilus sp.]